jgi:hypothetical protein
MCEAYGAYFGCMLAKQGRDRHGAATNPCSDIGMACDKCLLLLLPLPLSNPKPAGYTSDMALPPNPKVSRGSVLNREQICESRRIDYTLTFGPLDTKYCGKSQVRFSQCLGFDHLSFGWGVIWVRVQIIGLQESTTR